MRNEGQKDRPDKNHKFELLFRKENGGNLAVREYWYPDDHVIDALANYDCGTIGVKTITPICGSCIAMYIYIDVEILGTTAPYITVRSFPTAINTYKIVTQSIGAAPQVSHTEVFAWIPTLGNTFEIVSINDTVSEFKILGHKCKIN